MSETPKEQQDKDQDVDNLSSEVESVKIDEKNASKITIKVFDQVWRLDKDILSTSPYFRTLFADEDWKPDEELKLNIPDAKITKESLKSVLDSFQTNLIGLCKGNIISILSTAAYLQLDVLIEHCLEFMRDTMDWETSVDYFYATQESASTNDGAFRRQLENIALENLKICLTFRFFASKRAKITPELMVRLVGAADLCVQNEDVLFCAMVIWLYLRTTGQPFSDDENYHAKVDRAWQHFAQRTDPTPFLSTDAGRPYVAAFRQLRLRHLLAVEGLKVSTIRAMKILPDEWIDKALSDNWDQLTQLRAEYPRHLTTSEEFFDRNCQRCGFVQCVSIFSARFCDYLMGLVLICDRRGEQWICSVKRVSEGLDFKPLVRRDFLIRLKVVVTEGFKRVLYTIKSPIMKPSLKVGEDYPLLELDTDVENEKVYFIVNFMH